MSVLGIVAQAVRLTHSLLSVKKLVEPGLDWIWFHRGFCLAAGDQ